MLVKGEVQVCCKRRERNLEEEVEGFRRKSEEHRMMPVHRKLSVELLRGRKRLRQEEGERIQWGRRKGKLSVNRVEDPLLFTRLRE